VIRGLLRRSAGASRSQSPKGVPTQLSRRQKAPTAETRPQSGGQARRAPRKAETQRRAETQRARPAGWRAGTENGWRTRREKSRSLPAESSGTQTARTPFAQTALRRAPFGSAQGRQGRWDDEAARSGAQIGEVSPPRTGKRQGKTRTPFHPEAAGPAKGCGTLRFNFNGSKPGKLFRPLTAAWDARPGLRGRRRDWFCPRPRCRCRPRRAWEIPARCASL
jgi:hypothetical protein